MKHTRRHILATYFSLLSVFTLAFFAPRMQDGSTLRLLASQQSFGVPTILAEAVSPETNSMQYRIAERLRRRLFRHGVVTPPLSLLQNAIAERQAYFRNSVRLRIANSEEKELSIIHFTLNAHPLWLKPQFSLTDAHFGIDRNEIERFFREFSISGMYAPENIVITGISKNEETVRAETSGVAKKGEQLDVAESITLLMQALNNGEENITLKLKNIPGSVTNETEENLGTLILLATGRSNFAGSTNARALNVRKALRDHVSNTIVPPGATFSFNSTLGGPVTESRGWRMAQVIFEGDQLKPAPGGGICQASTTVYRAIVNAGFPVVERRAHSLYVSYYKKYGVGIDATIFPGTQDLTFLNDTEQPLLIQAYDDGYEAVVNIYGTPDGRTVELQGPYFSTNAPEGLLINDRQVMKNEIVWIQRVNYADGSVKENLILSRYKELPAYVRNEYAYLE